MNDALSFVHTYLHFPKLMQILDPYWTPKVILYSVLVLLWANYIWETYLAYRQHSLAKKTLSVPSELSGCIDQVTYTKSRDYHLDKSSFNFVTSFWEVVFQTLVLYFNGLEFLWHRSGIITAYFGYTRAHEITQTLVFSLLGSVISSLVDLPFSIYSVFKIEERHGFNKQTAGFFAKDKIKKFIVLQAIALPLIACVVHIVKFGGDYFFIYLWLFCVTVSLFLITLYADYIAPIFDKFTPLPEGELRTAIEQLAASVNFPLKKLFVVEGSKRSAHSNAYFYGFYKNKRIVLFDTLLKDYVPAGSDGANTEKETENETEDEKESNKKGCDNDEILAILTHELGHWKMNHVLKSMIIAQVNLFFCFMVFALLFKNSTLYSAFGFQHQKPVIIGLVIIFQYIFSPYHEILNFLLTMLSRSFEFQADAYAKTMNRAADLRSSLIKLNKDNLGFPVFDWLYSSWHHSHPPLLQRIKALGKID